MRGGIRFEVRGERVSHAGDEEAHRGADDDPGVHDHRVGVAPEETIFEPLTFFGVYDRERARRGVGRSYRRHDDERQPRRVSDRLGGVQRLPATDADDRIRARLACLPGDTLYLPGRALAAELDVDRPGQPVHDVTHQLLDDGVAHDQGLLRTDLLQDLVKPGDSTPTLNVLARRRKDRRKRPTASVCLHNPPPELLADLPQGPSHRTCYDNFFPGAKHLRGTCTESGCPPFHTTQKDYQRRREDRVVLEGRYVPNTQAFERIRYYLGSERGPGYSCM